MLRPLLFVLMVSSLAWSQPRGQFTLQALDAAPAKALGHPVMVDALLADPPLADVAIRKLSIKIDTNTHLANLEIIAPPALVPLIRGLEKGEHKVRLSGTVIAPTQSRGLYTLDVATMERINADGTTTPLKPPAVAPKTVESASPKAVAAVPASASPAAASEPEPPLATYIAGGLALAVGLVIAGVFWLLKKKAVPVDEPPPPTSVSDRLNKRVR